MNISIWDVLEAAGTSGTSCGSSPAWSAATVSASTLLPQLPRPAAWPGAARDLAGRSINDGMGAWVA
jgi:hypothetical protein